MRIQIKFRQNTESVPFDYQKNLVGAFHKWLGENHVHDEMSLYSLSWLMGGRIDKNGFDFKNGAYWQISSYDTALIKTLIKGIQNDPELNFGMRVKEVSIITDPTVEPIQRFFLNSPIFIKRKLEERVHHYTFSDADSGLYMTQTLEAKLKKAGLESKGVKVYFDPTFQKPSTKMINYNGIKCRASMCPVIIEGSEEQLKFAWNVGIGNSTGIGFGSLR
ncbi:CRISPR-associated endoribonuclease Cas6 [Lunatimonas salinarum]|uniref:CRISPR-associated endoribonuclease Cas6 n=1 Tax=Lunatimonas salinarum TaxID=1774590 RepID=UPI001ADF924F|nr:CRISPR-associated endoribonuclease Cas6 [Lunatimonas salinarum]